MENQLSFFQIRSVIHSNSLFWRSKNDMQNTTDNRRRLKIMRVLCPLIKWKIVIEIFIIFERERIKVSKYSQHDRETLGSLKISVLIILLWASPESYSKTTKMLGKRTTSFLLLVSGVRLEATNQWEITNLNSGGSENLLWDSLFKETLLRCLIDASCQ